MMAKPNYAFAKRQRDIAKKAKKEEKRLKKAEAQQPEDTGNPGKPEDDPEIDLPETVEE
jgi:hypothetical protein